MQINTATALSEFVGSLPTFIAVILAWMNSNKRIDDMRDLIKAEAAAIRSEMRRVEE